MSASTTSRDEQVKALQKKEARLRRIPLLPALLFTIVVTQVPFLFSLYFGFLKWRGNTPTPPEWIGFKNYTDAFGSSFFRDAAWTSILMTCLLYTSPSPRDA